MEESEEKRFSLFNDDVCIRLKLYGEDIKNLLIRNGWQEVDKKKKADYIFINSCSFLKQVEDKTLSTIEKIISNKKTYQEVVVFGCLPSIDPIALRKIHKGIFFSGRNLDEIAKKFDLQNVETKISHVVKRKPTFYNLLYKYLNKLIFKDDYFTYLYDKKKVFHLKISEGCLGKCTFCAERFARGDLKSKKINDIVNEFELGLRNDYQIFSLNADDTGVFGLDNKEDIVGLLERLLEHTEDYKLVITEFNPIALLRYEKELTRLLGSPKVLFITVPIQSGSTSILQKMNRVYEPKKILSVLTDIRAKNPDFKINTHIIVGFPGETERDFIETCELLDSFYFNKVKVFKYSERAGTAASEFTDKICEKTKYERYMYLRKKIIYDCLKSFRFKEFLLNLNYFF